MVVLLCGGVFTVLQRRGRSCKPQSCYTAEWDGHPTCSRGWRLGTSSSAQTDGWKPPRNIFQSNLPSTMDEQRRSRHFSCQATHKPMPGARTQHAAETLKSQAKPPTKPLPPPSGKQSAPAGREGQVCMPMV